MHMEERAVSFLLRYLSVMYLLGGQRWVMRRQLLVLVMMVGHPVEVFLTFLSLVEKVLPVEHDLVRQAVATPGLKIVFGTDAVAGADGRNAEEFIDRVRDSGQPPMDAMVSANSLGAAFWNE